ncbi:hypothetical protein BASA81_013743 [Batrachochytrium salamandrivorans]|nr:hypothetical protein BASA81_013743 [Batrachochytrium salamandrivorans]
MTPRLLFSSMAPTAESGNEPDSRIDVISQFSSVMTFLCCTAILGALIQGLAPRYVLKRIPHPTIVMIIFMLFGIIIRFTLTSAEVDFSVQHYIDPLMIQTLFLPLLMVAELFRMNTRAFFISLGQLVLLAGPGVVVCTLLLAVFPMYIMPSRPAFDFYLAMAFGGMLSTTDPVAIIICVNELAAPKRLATVVGGESLLNDGVSIIIVELFLELRNLGEGESVDAHEIVLFIFNQLLFSVLFGAGMGLVTMGIIRLVRDDDSTLVTLCVIMPIFTYVVSAYFMVSSGVLSMVPFGILLNEFGRGMMIEHVEQIERLYDQLSFIATTWLYALSGYVMGEVIASQQITGVDWGSLFILYFWLNLSRFIMIGLSYPFLKRMGYGFSISECILLSWGGLRGAVGLTLALTIGANESVTAREGSLIQFFMCGSIFLMIVNGVTAPFVLKSLQLNTKPNPKLLEALYSKMSERCMIPLENAGASKNRARWMAFGTSSKLKVSRRQRKLSSRRRQDSELDSVVSMQEPTDYMDHPLTNQRVNKLVLVEQRRHLVLAQRHIFERLLGRGLLKREAWHILDRSADHQLEQNEFQMDQFRFMLQRVRGRVHAASKLSRNFYQSTPGRLLRFLLDLGLKDAMEYMLDGDGNDWPAATAAAGVATAATTTPKDATTEEQGDGQFGFRHGTSEAPFTTNRRYGLSEDEDEDLTEDGWIPEGIRETTKTRSFGITLTAEDWCMNFLAASWGFLFAQQHSRHVVDDMFTVSIELKAFEEERQALHEEISHGSALPAQFINAVGTYAPQLMERLKQRHALSEAKNQLFSAVYELTSNGAIERADLKKLLKYAEKTIKRIQKQTFDLVPPITVGEFGERLGENPNFYPFCQHLREQERREKEIRDRLATNLKPDGDLVAKLKRKLRRRSSHVEAVEPLIKLRSHSFSEYDLERHELLTKLYFDEDEEETMRGQWDKQPVLDISKLMETLRLDDAELKRY